MILILILTILVESIIQTSLTEMSLYPFPKLMPSLHPLDFKDHPSLNKLHHLKSLTSNQCCRVAEPNAREHCNAFILRSGTQLEGPKGTGVEEESEKEKDKGATIIA